MKSPKFIDLFKSLRQLILATGLFLLIIGMAVVEVSAQGVAQVSLSGVPPVLERPSVTAQVDLYEQRQFNMEFIYTSPGILETRFRFRFLIEHEGNIMLDVTSLPVAYRPGVYRYENFEDFPEIEFGLSLADVISRLNAAQGGLINQTGNLAEGNYTLSVEPEVVDEGAVVSEIPAFASFTVRYAEPPILTSPADESVVSPNFPLFSWTGVGGMPAGAMVEYELKIVELFEGQTPGMAIQSNLPVLEEVMTNPTFVYGDDQLPLEPGKSYAWQVQARETVFNVPFSQEGLTEIYSFRVMDDEGYTTEQFVWSYPVESPFAEVRVEDARVGIGNMIFDGSYGGTIGNETGRFTFEEFILSPDGQIIEGGRAILDRSVSFGARILEDDQLDPFLPDAEKEEELGKAVWFRPGFLQISPDGITPAGIGTAALRYNGQIFPELDIRFSQDFLIGHGMEINRGRATFSENALDVAILDINGFRFITDESEDLIAQLPSRIPLPVEEVAWLRLRDEDGKPLVEAARTPDGSGVAITPLEGEILSMGMEFVAGSPELPVETEGLILAPSLQRLISGRVIHRAGDQNLLTDFGLPVEFEQITYSPEQSLELTGSLRLFGYTFADAGDVTLQLRENGRFYGVVNMHQAGLRLPLAGDGGEVTLDLSAIVGEIDIHPLSPYRPRYSFDVGADFVITGTSGTSIRADLAGVYHSTGDFVFNKIQPGDPGGDPAVLELDSVHLLMSRITHLNLVQGENGDFEFNAALETAIRLPAGNGEFTIPLQNTELRNTGFLIPDQNLHEGTSGFESVEFELDPVALRLLAMRLEGTVFPWFDWVAGTPSGIDPVFDFNVRFPGLRGRSEALATATATLQNAELEGGLISGSLLPYRLPGDGARVTLNGTSGIRVLEVTGLFYREGDSQGVDIDMNAVLHAPDLFAGEAETCAPETFTLSLTPNSFFDGREEGIGLCQTFDLNAVSLQLSKGFVDFSVAEGTQTVVAGGEVTGSLTNKWLEGADGSGTLELNVLTGEIAALNAEFSDLTWHYPASASVLSFGVDTSVLTPVGMQLDGTGSLETGSLQTEARFTELLLDLGTGEILEGEAEILGSFGLQASVSPYKWSVNAKSGLDDGDENSALLVLPTGQRITREGMVLEEATAAYARVEGIVDGEIDTEFNNFTLCFSPFNVCSGQIDLTSETGGIGYIDRNGFTFEEPVVETDLPARLGLPSEEIAYLILQEGDQQMVEITEDGSGGSLRMQTPEGGTVRLVLAGFGDEGSQPEIDAEINVTIHPTSYEITGGQIDLDLSGNPLLLESYGLPLEVTKILYSQTDGGSYALRASIGLVLPQSISEDPLGIDTMFTFSANGFEPVDLTLGNYSGTRLSNTDDLTPLVRANTDAIPAGMDLFGAEIKTGGELRFRFSGDFRSRFIRNSGGKLSAIHLDASFQQDDRSWKFTADLSHLSRELIPLYQAGFKQSPDVPLKITADDNNFSTEFSGTLTFPELGSQFQFSVGRLYIGSDGVEIEAAGGEQEISLFGEFLTLTVDDPGVNYDAENGLIDLTLNGHLMTNIQKARSQGVQDNEPFEVNGLIVSTDGSFALQSGDENLLGGEIITILGDFFWLDGIQVGFKEHEGSEQFLLTAAGGIHIPMPGKTSPAPGSNDGNRFGFIIDANGNVIEKTDLEFILDRNEWPELKQPNEPGFEYQNAIPGFATVQTTGVKVDYNVLQPVNTVLKGSFAVHVNRQKANPDNNTGTNNTIRTDSQNNQNTTPSDTTQSVDPEGNKRIIHFGKASSLDNRYGISHTFGDNLAYHVDVSGTREDPLFSFVAGFFNIDLVSVRINDPTVFEVEIGGYAGLTLSQVSGSMGYDGFRFGAGGITDFGRPTGAFSLSVEGIISLSVGGFAFEEQESNGPPVQMPVVVQDKTEDGVPFTSTDYRDVKRYLSLTEVGITMGGGSFEGGVERVLYYENMNNEIFFSIQDARITLSEAASIWANFNLAIGTGGDFALDVGGVANMQNFGIGVYGAVRKWEGELSFGIFAAGTGLYLDLFAPIGATNAVFLTGMGAGFFYRPMASDLRQVETLLNELTGDFSYNNPNGFPETDDLLFAIMLYGQVGIAGNPTAGFAATGNAMLILTDAFANLDVNAHLLEQVGRPNAPGTLKTGMYLTAGWRNNLMLQGGMKTEVEYPVVNGSSNFDFFLQGQVDSGEVLWGANGNVKLTLINFVDLSGDFTVNKSGMLVNLRGRISFDVSVISVESTAEFSFWYYSATQNLGVYTRFNLKAEVAGGLAKAGVFVEGALIVERGDFLVFVQGGGYISVRYVYTGDVNAWVSIRKDGSGTKFRGGLGRKKEYEDLIASSKNKSDNMLREAIELQSEIMNAKIADVRLSEAQLQQAGINLRSLSSAAREEYSIRMIDLERNTYDISLRDQGSRSIRPAAWNYHAETFQELADVIVRAPNQPERPADLPSEDEVNSALGNLNIKFDEISGQLAEMDQSYEPGLPGGMIEGSLQSPLASSGPYEFVVDETLEENRTQFLQNSFDQMDELAEQYRQLLESNAQVVSAYISGMQELNALVQETLIPFDEISEYYARQMSFHKDSYEYGRYLERRYREIAGWDPAQNNYRFLRDAYSIVADQLYPNSSVQANLHQTRAAIEHAVNQYALVLELAMEQDSLRQTGELEQSVSDFESVMNEIVSLGDNGPNGRFVGLINMAGRQHSNLWGSVLIYSYLPYMNWNRDEFNRLRVEHDDFLEEKLLPGYSALVRKMGRMYAILSKMVEEHISLYDSYIDWAGQDLTEEERSSLLEERRNWANLLKAPSIESVSTESYLFERTNHLKVTWEAGHPSGRLGQNVVRMIPVDGFRPEILLSTGTQTEFSRYLFPGQINQNEANYAFEFAVRGPAGTVTTFNTERASFEIGSGERYEDGVPGPVTDVNPDVEAPPAPGLDAPVREFEGQDYIINSEYIPFTAIQQMQVQTALEYEYAIRNTASPEGEWLVGWTPVETTTELPNGIPITGYWADLLGTDEEWNLYSRIQSGEEIEQSFHGYFESSPLEHGSTYELYVRAINAFGMESEPGVLRFTFDATPPVFENGEVEVEVQEFAMAEAEQREIIGFRDDRPARFEAATPEEAQSSEVRVVWPEVVDPESGIFAYHLVAGTEENPNRAFENEANARMTVEAGQQTEGVLPAALYSEPWYVHVRAQNYARSRSNLSSESQPPMQDRTRPYAGILRLGIHEGEPLLWESYPASDREVPVTGYQYAVGYIPFGTVSLENLVIMRPFPEGTVTDIPAGQYDIMAEGDLAPGFVLRDLDWSQIETHHPLYLIVRSVNQQGLTSDELVMSLEGMPIEFDDITPPVEGQISYQYQTNFLNYDAHYGEWLEIMLEGLHDPGSGVASVEFKLVDSVNGEVIVESTLERGGLNAPGSSVYETLRLPGEGIRLGGRQFLLNITATNGAGLQTEQSAEIDLTVPPIPEFGVSAYVEYRRQSEHLLGVNVRGIQPNATGFSLAEFRVEDDDTDEVLLPWTQLGGEYEVIPNFQDSIDLYFSDLNNDYWGRRLRISVRVSDGAGQTTTETIYYGRSTSQ